MTQPKTIAFPKEKTEFQAPSWDDMEQIAFELAKKINQDGHQFDRIVTLAKGGWPLTRSLVAFLQIDKVASIGVKFYKGVNQRLEQPEIYQDIPVSITGEKILLFDDVADTGESLIFTQDYLKTRGAKSVATAALYFKPHSKLKPDFYGNKTDSWIIFPYELVEMIEVLGRKWQKSGLGLGQINDRFCQLGFKQEWVDYYLARILT